jgi:hypothetical protein
VFLSKRNHSVRRGEVMRTYENQFDQMVQELLKQKQLYESLVLENQELHRQLANLRAGRGLFLQIGSERFALGEELVGLVEGASTSLPESESRALSQTEPETEPTTAVLPASSRREEQRTHASEPTFVPSKEEERATLRHELRESLMLD